MRSYFSLLLLLMLLSGFKSNAQQKKQNSQKINQNKLTQSKSSHLSDGLPVVSSYVLAGTQNPIGVFATKMSTAELKAASTFFIGDSLVGFNFEKNADEVFAKGVKLLSEFQAGMFEKQKNYVKKKFNLTLLPNYDVVVPVINSGSKFQSNAQIFASSCGNIDFENGDLSGWTASSGNNTNSNAALTILGAATTGINQSANSCIDVNLITSAYGNDTIGGFPGLDPIGASTSVRLGGPGNNRGNVSSGSSWSHPCNGTHWSSSGDGQKIEKTVFVTSANALFSYNYAVVLNDGGHAYGDQPYFDVYVSDTLGNILSSCAQYYVQVAAGSAPAGFLNSGFINPADNSIYYYRNWTSNSINLTPYIGQNVVVTVVTAGCTFGGHAGYAYMDAICGPVQITKSNSSPCAGSTVLLTAPPVQGGTYLWSGPGVFGQTTRTVNATANGNYTVTITPSQGLSCAYTVTTSLSFNTLPIANAGSTRSISCANTSTTLAGSGGGTYSWSGPGIVSGGNTPTPVVNAPGTYSLVVTNSFGCSSIPATVNVTSNLSTPTLTAIGSQWVALGCGASSVVVLSATATPAGSNYTWTSLTGSFVSGVNSFTVAINGVGTYTLNAKHLVSGCNATPIVFTVTPAVPPTFTAEDQDLDLTTTGSSSLITCANPTVFVSGGPTSGVTYTWTGSSVVSGVNTPTAGVNAPGIYSLAIIWPSQALAIIVPLLHQLLSTLVLIYLPLL